MVSERVSVDCTSMHTQSKHMQKSDTTLSAGIRRTDTFTLMVPCMAASLCFMRVKASRARFLSAISALRLLSENADAVMSVILATTCATYCIS